MNPTDKFRKIKTNSIQCLLCGDIIVSTNTHHFQECTCGNCAVDGGKDYLRRLGDNNTYIELSKYED